MRRRFRFGRRRRSYGRVSFRRRGSTFRRRRAIGFRM